jgi:hypothetical protein
VPVQSSGYQVIEPPRLSGHLKGCTRSAPSRRNLEKLMVGLSGGNTISALHMRMNSFLNDIMGRVRMNYFPVWCSAPMLGRTLFTFLVAITDPHNLPLATSPSFHYPRPPFLLLLMHVFLYPRSVYCKPNTM